MRTSAKRREQFTDFQVIGGDFPVVSAPLLALLRRFDAAAIEAVPVDVTLGDGSVITDGYFLCDVTKRLPIFDLERMRLKVVTIPNPDMSHPWTGYAGIDDPPALWGERMPSLRKAFLRPDIPADAHLFRDAVRRTDPYVSRALWEAIRAAGFIGLGFEWPDHLSQPPA